ncbi:MAG: DUF5671 domain-containing protein [bacterium]|nr:DUF5671 domain-containing protein [bacterium]
MENTPIKSTPKDVFLHLFNIVTFYLSVIGFITLYIQYINAVYPDQLNFYFTAIADSVRWSTSILFISVPAYLLTAWLLAKDLAVTPAKRELKLRKWLVYFTLFISAITIIIDLMIFVYNFLNGELTVQFFLKVLVVLAVAVAVFGYYMWELKRTAVKSKIPKLLAIIVSALVVISIIIGVRVIGTPRDQRNRRFDEQRMQNLDMLQNEIISYWTRKSVLPATLNDLQDDISGFFPPNDPGSHLPYEYKIIDTLTFKLCASFALSNEAYSRSGPKEIPYSYNNTYQQNWSHPRVGNNCFTRKIDPELYQINNDGQPRPALKPMR